MSDEQVVSIVSACPFVVGVKSESPPTSVAVAHLAPRVDVPVFGGLGGVGLLDELAAGSAGAMTGFSHPAALAAVLRAHRDGGFEAARNAWAPWLPLANFEGQPRVGLAIRKELLRRRGVIASGRVRRPAAPLPADAGPAVGQAFRDLARHLRDPLKEPDMDLGITGRTALVPDSCASERASYVIGSVVRVDGGLLQSVV